MWVLGAAAAAAVTREVFRRLLRRRAENGKKGARHAKQTATAGEGSTVIQVQGQDNEVRR